MAANGFNAIRTYTVPPSGVLDLAAAHGLRVMVGLPWEQHVAFLAVRRSVEIIDRVRASIATCAGHPAILCYAVGNEIPASIARWYGSRRIERFINRLWRAAKSEDPEGLVTYVNYPSTEYLDLPFLDLCSFNVFLETREQFEGYLARLQNIASDRPLILTELGLDSRRNGLDVQAEVVGWKLQETFATGAAGAFVFAWTDEWHRGGHKIEDWDFGLVDRQRVPKPALAAARRAFAELSPVPSSPWPRVSVVVCAYNAESTIRECLEGLDAVDYPDLETLVIDDGSTDATPEIAADFDVRLIRTENQGLAAARNVGLQAATGEIVAYLDSDASPDPLWIKHLARAFLRSDHAGVGGPNTPPPGEGWLAECIAKSPGGPTHVLLSDREAEHIPGCNMAFRKSRLEAVGGFDPQYQIAGDDVDVCWKMLDRGWTIGFSGGAAVWHHPRGSIRSYLKQQFHYGRAEALLERAWPEHYNGGGYPKWAGRIYGNGRGYGRRFRVYYGTRGGDLFQSRHDHRMGALAALAALPQWPFVIAFLTTLLGLSFVWSRLVLTLPLLGLAVLVPMLDAGLRAKSAMASTASRSRLMRLRCWAVLTLLHCLQPEIRRLGQRLAPSGRRALGSFRFPLWRTRIVWSERWRTPDRWISLLDGTLRDYGATLRIGGPYDRWDLAARAATAGSVRVRMGVEEHGSGRQLLRFRLSPQLSGGVAGLVTGLGLLSIAAGLDSATGGCAVLVTLTVASFAFAVRSLGRMSGLLVDAIEDLGVQDRIEENGRPQRHVGPLAEVLDRSLQPSSAELVTAIPADLPVLRGQPQGVLLIEEAAPLTSIDSRASP